MIVGIILGVILGFGVVLYTLMPKTPVPSNQFASQGEINAYFEQVVAVDRPPGLSAAVVKNGEIIYAEGFGFADAPNVLNASKDTVYHWWSMTKIPTAIAVMQLHERGLLRIDDPIKNYLPYLNVTFDDVPQDQITIRQLLDHSAGFSNAVPEIITWVHLEGEPGINQTDFFKEKLPDYTVLLFKPGTRTQYSNFGYMVLGALIEAVSNQSYEEYILENILAPLEMNNSGFVYTESMVADGAIGSQHLVDMFTPLYPLYRLNHIIRERDGMRLWLHRVYNDQTPPTGLIGPVTDVCLLLIDYLDEDSILLDSRTKESMNEILYSLTESNSSGQGLGWRAQLTDDGRRYLVHNGGGPGFSTSFRVYPDEGLGVVVMGNDTTINRERLVEVLANYDW